MLSQVQDDQLGKDIKCLVEIFQNKFIFVARPRLWLPICRLLRPFPLRDYVPFLPLWHKNAGVEVKTARLESRAVLDIHQFVAFLSYIFG